MEEVSDQEGDKRIPDDEGEPIEIFSIEAMFPNKTPEVMDPLLAFKAIADPDVMYLQQAMREKDKEEFIKAMKTEVRDQANSGTLTVI